MIRIYLHTHVEFIYVWIIDHFDKIYNIGMIQHFHYGYLQAIR